MSKLRGFSSLYYLVVLAIIVLAAVYFSSKLGLGDKKNPFKPVNVGQEQSQATGEASIKTDLGVAKVEDVPSGQITEGAVGSGMANYQNSALGFKISYPEGWSVGSYTLKLGYGDVVGTKGSAIAFSPSPLSSTSDKNTLLAAYLKSPITVIAFNRPISAFGDITRSGTATTVDGRQAIKKINSAKGIQNIFVNAGNVTYEIVFNSSYGGDQNLFNRMLASFEVL